MVMLRMDDTNYSETKLSILIVSFNTKEMTLKCIESIFAETTNLAFELIIIDNASSDGSAEALKNLYSHKAKVFALMKILGLQRRITSPLKRQ